MNLLILSSILIIVLCLAIYAMTRQNAIEIEIQRLVKQNSIEQLYHEYRANHRTLNLYMIGGILLTGGFALTFFGGGGIDPRAWTFEQYAYAVIGLVATVSITLGQRSLYRSIKQNISALLVTLLILAFVIFSEVATTSEREASLVRDRSLDSPTLQALLNNIQTPQTDDSFTRYALYYQEQITQAEQQLRSCDTDACKTEQEDFLIYLQNQLKRSEQQQSLQASQRRSDTLAFADKAQAMEYNEQNHSAVIRWIQEHSAATFTAAMMFASLIFVIAFESGFHFTGTKEGIYLEAIARLGYSVSRQTQRPRRVSNALTQTIPKAVPERTDTVEHNVDTKLLDEMRTRYQQAKHAKAGDTIHCPFCEISFEKKTHNQTFCQRACKDDYWNTIKPERLQTVRGG